MSQTARRRIGALVAGGSTLAAFVVTGPVAGLATTALAVTGAVPHPTVAEYVQLTTSATPPTEAQCESVGRLCFNPASTRSAYDLGPLYDAGFDGSGVTIAIVDSYGSDTMAHDLMVYNNAWGLPHMCGEEGQPAVSDCPAGTPWFKTLHVQGAPATKAPPSSSKGTGQEDKSAWALEVALDVETAHSIAPGANILLVTTPTAETLGVQGFPQMMNAEQYVVDNHLAQVISQSFASAEDAFGSFQSLENLRHAFKSAAANGVTVLGSSGDGGTANFRKTPVGQGGSQINEPTVEWPASDPLVTGVGGTYLCTDPLASQNDPRTNYAVRKSGCARDASQEEIGWVLSGGGFSHYFGKPAYQNTLPTGSTAIDTMRGVPDVGLQASAGTGALVYLTLPPDGLSGLSCGSAPCSTGWYDIGGTSLSCPEWAGMVAITNQIAKDTYGVLGLGLLNDDFYSLASSASYSTYFHDITVGNNTNPFADPPVAGYPATPGWDPVTGLGTPDAAQLLPALAASATGH